MNVHCQAALCAAAFFAAVGSSAAQIASAPAAGDAGDGFRVEYRGANGALLANVYHNAHGKQIDAATFAKAIKSGSTYSPAIDPAKKIVTLTLQTAAPEGNGLAIRTGQKLPDFHLPTLNHNVASPSMLVGKPTLVDFFFADCVACIEELPALNAYAAKHPEMNFLAVTFDDAKTARDFVRQRHFGWSVAYDGKPLVEKLGMQNFPTMLLLDAEGNLLTSYSGSIPIEVKQTRNSPVAEPSKAESQKLQLQWLGHWVANAPAHLKS